MNGDPQCWSYSDVKVCALGEHIQNCTCYWAVGVAYVGEDFAIDQWCFSVEGPNMS